MNAQHKLNRIENRLCRIDRRLIELDADKIREIIVAEEHHRDPNLGTILAHMNRLKNRRRQLQ